MDTRKTLKTAAIALALAALGGKALWQATHGAATLEDRLDADPDQVSRPAPGDSMKQRRRRRQYQGQAKGGGERVQRHPDAMTDRGGDAVGA